VTIQPLPPDGTSGSLVDNVRTVSVAFGLDGSTLLTTSVPSRPSRAG